MLRYTKFQYYNETTFSKFCTAANLECLLCLPFGAKIVCTITWRMIFWTWKKPWKPGDNLEFYNKNKLGTLYAGELISPYAQYWLSDRCVTVTLCTVLIVWSLCNSHPMHSADWSLCNCHPMHSADCLIAVQLSPYAQCWLSDRCATVTLCTVLIVWSLYNCHPMHSTDCLIAVQQSPYAQYWLSDHCATAYQTVKLHSPTFRRGGGGECYKESCHDNCVPWHCDNLLYRHTRSHTLNCILFVNVYCTNGNKEVIWKRSNDCQ